MAGSANPSSAGAPAATGQAATLRRRLQIGCFVLEGLNGWGTPYYLNYLFFYMQAHFGFGNRDNLLLTALHGFTYMISAWSAGHLAHRFGYLRLLWAGFGGMLLAMILGGLIPHFFGYSATALHLEWPILVLWTVSMCLTWPTLQSLVTHQTPGTLPRTAGIYNVVWSGTAALSFLTGGALLERFGGEMPFWLPVGFHVAQLLLLIPISRWQKLSLTMEAAQPATDAEAQTFNPQKSMKARSFLRLAWVADPFADIAIYGLIPVIPRLSEKLDLTTAQAGLVCSVWFWVRLGAFVWFWLWPGWHYRFRWLLTAFVALIGSFVGILLSAQVWTLVASQVVFGLAIGLIYYSSLFYSMDAGASRGKSGGIHEAAIGLGICLGPLTGAAGLYFFPGHPNAGTWNIAALLVVGLLLFLLTRLRHQPRK